MIAARVPWLTVLALAAITAAGWQSDKLLPLVNPKVERAGANLHESDASVSLLGQFRTSLSTWLWLKSDLYLHNGVEMRPITEEELANGLRNEHDADGWHEASRDTAAMTTVIPGRSRDFRGLLGELERATTTYQDMTNHHHNEPFDTVPLYRLINWCDPSFTQAWVAGAMAIAGSKQSGAPGAALAYIQEGVRQNPDSIVLLTDCARLRIRLRGELEEVLPTLERACELGAAHYEWLPENEREATTDAFRWLALVHKSLGNLASAELAARRGLRVVKGDPVLERFLNLQPALLLPEKGEEPQPIAPKDGHVHSDTCGHSHHMH